jgi:predicted Zn-dependent protease
MRIVLVQDSDLNAFTAGGMDIFMTTGLIMAATNPEEIMGVLAHEAGHITGGHVLAHMGKAKTSSYETIITTVLGMGAGLLTGNGQVASAISTIGRASAINSFLAHSRTDESAADQAALTFLQTAKVPSSGLVSFMEKLSDQELLPPAQQNAFARTHPVTRDRIAALRHRSQSAQNSAQLSPQNTAQLKRIQAKLLAYIEPEKALQQFTKNDVDSLMARAIANYRKNRLSEALKYVDQWLAQESQNPYAHELKAQILKDAGKPHEAVPVYEKALTLAPREALIRIDASHAMIEANENALLEKAIRYLNTGLQDEPRSTFAFRLLSTAYARQGLEAEAQICLAEIAVLERDYGRARHLLTIAKPRLGKVPRMVRRASDLEQILDTLDKDKEDQ